jgi:hypothetical protein
MGLPGVLVLPDMRLDGPVAGLLRAVAMGRNLSVAETDQANGVRFSKATLDADAYLARSVSRHHRREMRRQWRRLSEHGELSYMVARQPEEIRYHLEEFLTLEDSGWKGRRRSRWYPTATAPPSPEKPSTAWPRPTACASTLWRLMERQSPR